VGCPLPIGTVTAKARDNALLADATASVALADGWLSGLPLQRAACRTVRKVDLHDRGARSTSIIAECS